MITLGKNTKVLKEPLFFHFNLNRSLEYGNPIIFLLAINCKNKKCSLILLQKCKNRQML